MKTQVNQVMVLIVKKEVRQTPLPDLPIRFESLQNLHLELLENKKKLKKNLPLIPLRPKKPNVQQSAYVPEDDETSTAGIEKNFGETKPSSTIPDQPQPSTPTPKPRSRIEQIVLDADDLAMQEELGVSEEELEFEEEDEEHQQEDDPYAGLSPEEREAREREEYIWRFRIMKKQYPGKSIPEFNEFSDVRTMKSMYEMKLKELHLEDSVETYRTYLMGGFMLLEMGCTSWLGIDMSGFTIQQSKMMHKYERLLIELGERSYSKFGSSLPVEVRIILTILFQGAIFYLGKIISSKVSESVGDIFKGFTGQPPVESSSGSAPSSAPKKKMRGHRIHADEVREMAHKKEE